MAIAFDAATSDQQLGVSSHTYSHTVAAGSNMILFVCSANGEGASTDRMSGVTYNGTSMTAVNSKQLNPNGWTHIHYLAAPSTGANNVTITWISAVGASRGVAVSYSGASQTGIPDSQTTGNQSTSPQTCSTTVVTDQSWLLMNNVADRNITASTGATVRSSGWADVGAVFDSNGGVGTGSQSMQTTTVGTASYGYAICSFAPAAAASTATRLPQLLTLSVG